MPSSEEVFNGCQDITSLQESLASPSLKKHNTQINSNLAIYTKPTKKKQILSPHFMHSRTSKSGKKQSKQRSNMNKLCDSVSNSRHDKSSEKSSRFSKSNSFINKSLIRKLKFNKNSSKKVNVSDYVGIVYKGKTILKIFYFF